MPRGIFRSLTLTEPPKIEDNAVLTKWLSQTAHELQRFAKDVSNFLVQDIAVARVSKQELINDFQVMSDGLFVELFSTAAVTSHVTQAFRPGVIGAWLILHNIGLFDITIKNNAGTKLGADVVLGPEDTLSVRYDGEDWVKFAQGNN